MQQIEFADILSTDLQLAHTGYLTHALCLQGTATLLFNGAAYPLQPGDCIIMQRSESAQITGASADFLTITVYVTPEFIQMAMPLSTYGTRGHMMLFNDPVMAPQPAAAVVTKDVPANAIVGGDTVFSDFVKMTFQTCGKHLRLFDFFVGCY